VAVHVKVDVPVGATPADMVPAVIVVLIDDVPVVAPMVTEAPEQVIETAVALAQLK
jgi:hypothetical protein